MTRQATILSAFAIVFTFSLPAHAISVSPVFSYNSRPIANWDFGNASPLVDDVGGRVMTIVEDRPNDVVFDTITDRNGVTLDLLNFTNSNERAYAIVNHNPADALTSGIIHIRGINTTYFNNPRETIVSKDHYSYGSGGHFTVDFLRTTSTTGHVEVRLQSKSASKYVVTSSPISTGQFVDVMVAFGPDFGGLQLFLDRDLSDSNPAVLEDSSSYSGGIENNIEPWIFGSSLWRQSPPASQGGVDRNDLIHGLSGGIAGFSIHEIHEIPEPGTFLLTVCAAPALLLPVFYRRRK